MTNTYDPLIRLESVKKVFYTDEVETHALEIPEHSAPRTGG